MDYDFLRKEKMAALKEKDTLKNSVITMLLSGLTYKKKELGREPNEADCYDVIAKELKQVKESLEMAKGREDLYEELKKKEAILEGYMPKQLSEEEISEKVRELLLANGIEPTISNKGAAMKVIMAELKGKADGKLINKVVGDILK